jgi:HEAT repeat protein
MWKPFLLAAVAVAITGAASRAADTADEKLVRELVAVFQDPKNKPEVRTTAIRALGALGWTGRSALPDLIKLLDDPAERKWARDATGPLDQVVPFYQAIIIIGQMGSGAKEAVPVLVKAKGFVPLAYDSAIDTALRNILQPEISVFNLLNALRDNEPSVRLMAARALRNFPADNAVVLPVLLAATKDPDPDVSRVAEESYRQVMQAEVNRLQQLLKDDKDERVRVLAAKALGRLGPAAAAAVDALTKAAKDDPDPDVQDVAKNALKKIRPGG